MASTATAAITISTMRWGGRSDMPQSCRDGCAESPRVASQRRAERAPGRAQNPGQPARAMPAEHGTEASAGEPVPRENGAADWSYPMPAMVTSVPAVETLLITFSDVVRGGTSWYTSDP